ncbi:unnamed protein product [Caenorhabditis bovis]|uniref:Tryptophan synthase beta chain-like PALP domain-containing protein n=1 Tax=Caenorhabditis bovis TaxID=2654633 RepID=A0A8S1EWG2_9PELO|nr:unnamed protein product [Caenorhabditis bovis]
MFAVVVAFAFANYFLCVANATPIVDAFVEHQTISLAPNDELTDDKTWTKQAMQKMWEERKNMGRTNIYVFKPKGMPHVSIVFKNESSSPTESLKHRYAWALMTWALLEQKIKNGTHVFEASSGNTAFSLGYMCRKLGLPFTAVVPDTLEEVKQQRIRDQGAEIHKVPIGERLKAASQLAEQNRGFFMNQFKNAYYAEEFHESGDYGHESANIFHEILQQLRSSRIATPHYFVHSAGTGGTITSIGRYAKKYGVPTEIVLADTQFSIYYDYVLRGKFTNASGASQWVSPGMAGVGYGPMGAAKLAATTSLDPAVIDRALKLPDVASTAAIRVANDHGIRGGTSTGVNLLAALHVAASATTRRPVVIATILADSANYYRESYLNREWIADKFEAHGGLKVYDCWRKVIKQSIEQGTDPLAIGNEACRNDKIH